MNDQINSAAEWLQSHYQHTVMIDKHEQEDQDRTRLQLEYAEYAQSIPTTDDYTEGDCLLLRGAGAVLNGQGEVPLPQNVYEIHLTGLSKVTIDEHQLMLKTERATYRISAQS